MALKLTGFEAELGLDMITPVLLSIVFMTPPPSYFASWLACFDAFVKLEDFVRLFRFLCCFSAYGLCS